MLVIDTNSYTVPSTELTNKANFSSLISLALLENMVKNLEINGDMGRTHGWSLELAT
jgi:hypothetical protein